MAHNITHLDSFLMGNALADILVPVPEDEFLSLGIERGESTLTSAQEQLELLLKLDSFSKTVASGGSAVNSSKVMAQLGANVAACGKVGDDKYGELFLADLSAVKVTTGNPFVIQGPTGTSVVLVTPDSERSMRVALGAAAKLGPDDIDPQAVRVAKWLFVEGYLLGNGSACQEAVLKAVRSAEQYGVPVAISLSSKTTIRAHRSLMEQLLDAADLVIGNSSEANELTGADTWQDSFDIIRDKGKAALISSGPHGAFVGYGALRHAHVPAFKTEIVDLTGAGDALAGGFLYGITHGLDPVKAARLGCEISSKVISHLGAGLRQDEIPDLAPYR